MSFDPESVGVFELLGYSYNRESREATLRYALGDHVFHEIITFTGAPVTLTEAQRAALDRCLKYLHMAAGVSYYKAAVPATISSPAYTVSAGEASFFDHFYLHGLGEFAYQNGLDLSDRIRFPVTTDREPAPLDLKPGHGQLVPVGGGKDSIVTIELVKKNRVPTKLVSVGDSNIGESTAETAGLPLLRIKRRVSHELVRINAVGALNGHVPITGILSFIFAAAAVLYDLDTIVMSNERSASEGNVVLDSGFEVNHQYSKSLDFETRYADFVATHVSGQLNYFSMLRPLSELSIAAMFSTMSKYHYVFTSCNSNFRITGERPDSKWCLDCPKCRFVFLAVAPYMERSRLLDVFGGNLLADVSQVDGFRELLGLGALKPFECVGEIAESRAALAILADRPDWRDEAVVRALLAENPFGDADRQTLISETLTPSTSHRVPKNYLDILDDARAAG